MSEERHPLVQSMIDICEQAVKDNDPVDKLMKDLGLDVDTHDIKHPSVKHVQLSSDELINFLQMMGMSKEEIKKLLEESKK